MGWLFSDWGRWWSGWRGDPAPPGFSLAQRRRMTYVYVFQSMRDKKMLYIGFTSNLRHRVKAHQDGLSRTTRRYRPMRLVYYEAFQDVEDGRAREKVLKQFGGAYRELLRRIRRSRLVVLLPGGAG